MANCSPQKMEESLSTKGLSPSSPVSPIEQLLDADAANILSRLSPDKSNNALISNEMEENNNQQGLDLKLSDCSSSAEKEPESENALENPDSNPPVTSSNELQEKIVSSCESSLQNKDLNDPNDSTTLSGKTESLDKDASLDTESNVPIFCLTISEGSETEKGIETDTMALNDYREEKELDSDDSSVDSDSSSDCSDSFLYELRKSVNYTPGPKTYNVPPPTGYYDVEELIAIEDLDINVKESEVEKVGIVHGIVELEVIIKSKDGLKPLQLNSVLFLSNEKPLGHVCDVLGPVKNPYYSVMFNSKEHMKKVGVEVGQEVFYAPERKEITKYILPEDLRRRYRGSDASGINDDEPSDDNLDYSDDEAEREARFRRKKLRRLARDKERELRGESGWADEPEHSPESSEPNANPFYSMNRVSPDRSDWTSSRHPQPSSYSYKEVPRRHQEAPGNLAHTRNLIQCHPPASVTPRSSPQISSYQPPYHSPISPYPVNQPYPSPFQTPSPLARLQFPPAPQGSPIPFSLPSPIPHSQPMAHSQRFVHQQQPPMGPPRPISLQQMHMFGQMTPLGPMSPAPRVSYGPPTISSPPPSTAFPPASPNFSYFSHPFPSAPSPSPNMAQYQTAPSPGPIQSMSPLSIQIPNNMRSPAPVMATNGHNYHNHNVQQHQQNFAGLRSPAPVMVTNGHNYHNVQQHQQNFTDLRSPPPVMANGHNYHQHNVQQHQLNFGGYGPLQRY